MSAEPRLALTVPDELVEVIARRVVEILDSRPAAQAPSPWLNLSQAAQHLACPRSRLYALVGAGRIPHHKDGSRLLFRREELDAYVAAGGARRQ